MIHSTIDTIAHTNKLRHVDTRLKVLFAVTTLLITVASTSPIPPLLAFLTATIMILFAAKIKPRTYFLLLLTPLFFVLVNLLMMSLFFGYNSPLYSFELLSRTFEFQKDGINMGLLIGTRTLAGSACLFFLALTTPMTELFTGLKWLRIPDVVIELAMIIYRYIFVFLEEAERMWLASRMRGESNFRTKIKVFSMLASTLFLRSIIQGEKLFVAMNSRCYEGETNSLCYQEKNSRISATALFGILVFEFAFAYLTIMTQNVALI